MTVDAIYSLDENDDLRIEYVATTDRPTIANITNHAYWNLSGEGSANGAMGHVVTIPAESYLPTDSGAIPTGEYRPVAGTVFDFRKPTAIGERVRSEEHTSELQSLMRISYAVFRLKKHKTTQNKH